MAKWPASFYTCLYYSRSLGFMRSQRKRKWSFFVIFNGKDHRDKRSKDHRKSRWEDIGKGRRKGRNIALTGIGLQSSLAELRGLFQMTVQVHFVTSFYGNTQILEQAAYWPVPPSSPISLVRFLTQVSRVRIWVETNHFKTSVSCPARKIVKIDQSVKLAIMPTTGMLTSQK